jgi:hypothetical protein
MTTLRHIYHTVAGIAEHGRSLPAAEQAAWQAVAGQCQDLADLEEGYRHAEDASADYGDEVWALYDRLVRLGTPAGTLAGRWVSGWLTEYADPETFGRVQGAPPAVVIARALPGNRLGQALTAAPPPRPPARRPTPPPVEDGWAVLLVGEVRLETAVDHGCLTTISSAAELTCLADGRPWTWQRDGATYQAHIGPPPGPGGSPAGQLVADLQHLALGLNPGPWRITTLPRTSNQPRPQPQP